MHLNDLGDYLESQFEYPVLAASVRDQIGDETIDSEEQSGGRTFASRRSRVERGAVRSREHARGGWRRGQVLAGRDGTDT